MHTQCFSDKDPVNFLEKNGILVQVRKLSVGDYIWICQNSEGEELVLPYVIERKRFDDFSKSISDGRFHEQKVCQLTSNSTAFSDNLFVCK